MIILGITGGVGAGKSTVLGHLAEKYGAFVLQADEAGHLLMRRGAVCYAPIVDLFGEEILDGAGEIDRKKVAAIVFSDSALLEKLNAIVHPAVKSYILETVEEKKREKCPLFVLEAALLLEEQYDKICDDLWYIRADDDVRRKRLKADRGYSDEKIDGILRNQLSDAVFREKCRYIVDNSGKPEATFRQVDERIDSYEIV